MEETIKDKLNMKMSTLKTKVLACNRENNVGNNKEKIIEQVDDFMYLRSTIGQMGDEK